MTCYHPIAAWRDPSGYGVTFSKEKGGDRCDLPCGKCLGCRERRARDWSLRCMHESSLWKENCFVTLTYGRDKMPPGGSLEHRDFQLFMKRMRRANKQPIRFFMCGEYGPRTMRPHYHAILFNKDFRDRKEVGRSKSGESLFESDALSGFWIHGRSTVQDCNAGTVAYCTRYVVDKMTGSEEELREYYTTIDSDGVIVERKPPYCACSLKPGIGSDWFRKYHGDLYNFDYAVLDGRKYAVPKYYDKLLARDDLGHDVDGLEFSRVKRGLAARTDSTDERLAEREIVHKARVRNLVRDGND